MTKYFSVLVLFVFGIKLIGGTLETNNPFLPKDYVKQNIIPQAKPQPSAFLNKILEFKGFYTLRNTTQFSIYNKQDKKSYWISRNQSEGGIRISDFDERSKSVTISMNGRTERLTLMSATSTPIPVAVSTALFQNPTIVSPDGTYEVKSNSKTHIIPRRRVILPQK